MYVCTWGVQGREEGSDTYNWVFYTTRVFDQDHIVALEQAAAVFRTHTVLTQDTCCLFEVFVQ